MAGMGGDRISDSYPVPVIVTKQDGTVRSYVVPVESVAGLSMPGVFTVVYCAHRVGFGMRVRAVSMYQC